MIFVYIWGFVGAFLIIKGITSSQSGEVNKKAFLYGAIAILAAIANYVLK